MSISGNKTSREGILGENEWNIESLDSNKESLQPSSCLKVPGTKRVRVFSTSQEPKLELPSGLSKSVFENHLISGVMAPYMSVMDICMCMEVSQSWQSIWEDILTKRIGGPPPFFNKKIHANVLGLIPDGPVQPEILTVLMGWKTLKCVEFWTSDRSIVIERPPHCDLDEVVSSIADALCKPPCKFTVDIFKVEAFFNHGVPVDITALSTESSEIPDESSFQTYCEILNCRATIQRNGHVHLEGKTFEDLDRMAVRVKGFLLTLDESEI